MEQLCTVVAVKHELNLLIWFQVFEISPVGIQVVAYGLGGHHQDHELFVGSEHSARDVAGVIRVVHAGVKQLPGHVLIEANCSRVGFEGA